MKDHSVLKIGDVVLIALPYKGIDIVPEMRQYDGEETYITKVHRTKISNGANLPYGYELAGAVSRYGVPFVFSKEMLIKLED